MTLLSFKSLNLLTFGIYYNKQVKPRLVLKVPTTTLMMNVEDNTTYEVTSGRWCTSDLKGPQKTQEEIYKCVTGRPTGAIHGKNIYYFASKLSRNTFKSPEFIDPFCSRLSRQIVIDKEVHRETIKSGMTQRNIIVKNW